MGQVTVLDSTGATQTVNNGVAPDGSSWVDSTTQGALVQGLYQATPQTMADNTVGPIHTDSNGRVIVSPGSAENTSVGAVKVMSAGISVVWVNVSSTNTPLQITAGAIGDYIESLVCVVSNAANSQVSIKDGTGTAHVILPPAVGGGVNTYPIPLGWVSTSGAWQITTGSGVTVFAAGKFS